MVIVAYPPAWPVIAEAVGWTVGIVATWFGAKATVDTYDAMMAQNASAADEAKRKAEAQPATEAATCEACGNNGDKKDDKDPKKKKKASNSKSGEDVRTPDTHPEDFSKNRSGQYTNKNTGEIWEKSHTQHSGGPEWKVGSRPGVGPRVSSKITVRGGPSSSGGGRIIKID